MRGLKPYTQRIALSVWFQLRSANSDGREHRRGRKSSLTRFDEYGQIHATYGWTKPAEKVAKTEVSANETPRTFRTSHVL